MSPRLLLRIVGWVIVVAAVYFFLYVYPKAVRGRAAKAAPHVLLIQVDGVRPERMSLLGCERPTTPMLKAFAQRGALFSNVAVQGDSPLAAAQALLDSSNPASSDAGSGPDFAARPSLVDQLRAQGYSTEGYLTATPDDGFAPVAVAFAENQVLLTGGQGAGELAQAVAQRLARARQSGRKAGPMFLYARFAECRAAPPPFDAKFSQGRVPTPDDLSDGALAYVDRTLGLIFEELSGDFLAVVAFTPASRSGSADESRPLPLIVVWPGRIAAGLAVPLRATLLDVGPTVLGLSGSPPLGSAQGRDLSPALQGRSTTR